MIILNRANKFDYTTDKINEHGNQYEILRLF